MKTILRDYIVHNLAFWACFLISAGLIVGGFLVPPLGKIDGSVLKGVGELFAYATLWVLYVSIKHGINATIKKGDLEVSLDSDNDD